MGDLSPKQRVFVTEYLKDFNQTRAARCAGSPASNAHVAGSHMIREKNVLTAIHQELVARRDRAEIDVDEVARYWYDLATADPRELITVDRCCCRYCWGIDHDHQYTLNEMRDLRRRHHDRYAKTPQDRRPMLDERGGEGFDAGAAPNPDCPECRGRGLAVARMPDLANLSRGAVLLLDGARITRTGEVEIKLRDRSRALENLQLLRGMMKPIRSSLDIPPIDQMPDASLDRMLEDARRKNLLTDEDLHDGVVIEGEFSEAE